MTGRWLVSRRGLVPATRHGLLVASLLLACLLIPFTQAQSTTTSSSDESGETTTASEDNTSGPSTTVADSSATNESSTRIPINNNITESARRQEDKNRNEFTTAYLVITAVGGSALAVVLVSGLIVCVKFRRPPSGGAATHKSEEEATNEPQLDSARSDATIPTSIRCICNSNATSAGLGRRRSTLRNHPKPHERYIAPERRESVLGGDDNDTADRSATTEPKPAWCSGGLVIADCTPSQDELKAAAAGDQTNPVSDGQGPPASDHEHPFSPDNADE